MGGRGKWSRLGVTKKIPLPQVTPSVHPIPRLLCPSQRWMKVAGPGPLLRGLKLLLLCYVHHFYQGVPFSLYRYNFFFIFTKNLGNCYRSNWVPYNMGLQCQRQKDTGLFPVEWAFCDRDMRETKLIAEAHWEHTVQLARHTGLVGTAALDSPRRDKEHRQNHNNLHSRVTRRYYFDINRNLLKNVTINTGWDTSCPGNYT